MERNNGQEQNAAVILQVYLGGHKDFYNLQDVLRLFYGLSNVVERSETAAAAETANYLELSLPAESNLYRLVKGKDFKICSSLHTQSDGIALKEEICTKLLVGEEEILCLKNTLSNCPFPAAAWQAWTPKEREQAALSTLLNSKRLIKKQLYDLLSQIEKICFPWGSLTGIRPTYVATEIYHLLYNLYQPAIAYGQPNVEVAETQATLAAFSTCSPADFAALTKKRLPTLAYKLEDLWQLTADYLQLLFGLAAPKAQLAAHTAMQENILLSTCEAQAAGSASPAADSAMPVTIGNSAVSSVAGNSATNESANKLLSLYIGIPFCATRCAYCSFAPRDGIRAQQEVMDNYVSQLIKEIELLWPAINLPIQTLYIGGGTPSALDGTNLERLFNCLQSQKQWSQIQEKTFEAGRADTIDENKLALVKRAGFDHICINPQTFNDNTLKRIGRSAYAADVDKVMRTVQSLNFKVCNMDLIMGLPGETKEDMLVSLERSLAYEPENITLHTLAFKRKSWLGQMRKTVEAVPLAIRENSELKHFVTNLPALSYVSSDLHVALQSAQDRLYQANYRPYYMYRQKDALAALENTGFAKVGKGSGNLYNVLMMSDKTSILAFGACAMSKFLDGSRIERFSNARSVQSYAVKYLEHSQAKLKLVKEYL